MQTDEYKDKKRAQTHTHAHLYVDGAWSQYKIVSGVTGGLNSLNGHNTIENNYKIYYNF